MLVTQAKDRRFDRLREKTYVSTLKIKKIGKI